MLVSALWMAACSAAFETASARATTIAPPQSTLRSRQPGRRPPEAADGRARRRATAACEKGCRSRDARWQGGVAATPGLRDRVERGSRCSHRGPGLRREMPGEVVRIQPGEVADREQCQRGPGSFEAVLDGAALGAPLVHESGLQRVGEAEVVTVTLRES